MGLTQVLLVAASMTAAPVPAPTTPEWQLTVEQTLPAGPASKDVWVGLTNTGTAASAICVPLVWFNVGRSLHADQQAFSQQRCETDRDAHLVLPQQSYFVLISLPAFHSGMVVDLVLDVASWKADQPISPAGRRVVKVRGSFAQK